MIPKPIDQIGATDFAALVAAPVPENKTIEYKREMADGTRDEKVKLLAAVTSFANTQGGDLLIGIEAKNGIPLAYPGVACANVDAEKLRIEQLLRDNIEPRLPSVEIKPIATASGNCVFVIRLQRSWLAPHRVKINDKFYGRTSAGKYPLDVGELRSAFVLSESTAERIRNFRADRLMQIAARDTLIGVHDGPLMVVHAIPFAAFATGRSIDPYAELGKVGDLPFPPGRTPRETPLTHVNLDGFALVGNPNGGRTHAYGQLFRSGAVEGVTTLSGDTEKHYMHAKTFAGTAVRTIRNYLDILRLLDMGLPVVVCLSFTGMSRCHFRVPDQYGGHGYYDRPPIQRDTIALPEVVIDREPADVPMLMRDSFNTIWNAYGYERSDAYDGQGNWTG